MVREKGVNPMRVKWRGKQNHAFLVFKDLDTAGAALKELEGLKYEDSDLIVKMSNKFAPPEEQPQEQ